MQKVSVRTLVLLFELFAAVLAHQCLAWSAPARAEAIWLGVESKEMPESPSPLEYADRVCGCSALSENPNEPEPERR